MVIQIAAGVAAALLSVGMFIVAMASPSSARLLVQFVPLPLFVAGLAIGPLCGWIAAGVAFAGLLATLGFGPALSHGIGFALPAAVLSSLAALPRLPRHEDPSLSAAERAAIVEAKGRSAGTVVAAAAIIAGCLGVALLLIVSASGAELISGLKADLIAEITRSFNASAAPASTIERVRAIVEFLIDHLSELAAAGFAIILLGNTALAAWISRLLGRATRPLTDLGRLQLPFWFIVALLGALALTFLGGIAAVAARTFVAPGLVALAITGLAILHEITRGSRYRFPTLTLAYIALFTVGPIAVAIFVVLALVEPLTSLRSLPPATPS